MVIGIDLGTTYSAVSYLNEKMEPEIVLNRENEISTPSVVFVDGKDVAIGKEAQKKGLQWPEKICRCIKRHMGFRHRFLQETEENYSPETISALIIRRLIEDVMTRREGNIEGIVVTVPTSFDNPKRTATIQAVKAALEAMEDSSQEIFKRIRSVKFIEVINEPEAAALYYCHKSKRKQGRILIYDLGGGTFDAALIEIDGNTISVIGRADEHAAGGSYFDNMILDYVIKEVNDKHHINLLEKKYRSEKEIILMDVENSKKLLSKEGVDKVDIAVRCKHKTCDVALTKDKFNEIILPLVHRTQDAISDMLDENGFEAEDIDEVVLVGGSSKIPYIRECLREIFQKDLCEDVDPEKAVVFGASIHADRLLKERKDNGENSEWNEQENVLKINDFCTYSIGILTIDLDTGEKVDDILIEEKTPLVAEVERSYETRFENQTYIKLEITEGGCVINERNFKLPQGLKMGTEVIVRIVVNTSHMIEVYLKVPSIAFSKKYIATSLQNLSEEEQKELSGLVASKKIH